MKLRELVGKFDIVDILGFTNKFGREDFHTLASEIGPILRRHRTLLGRDDELERLPRPVCEELRRELQVLINDF